jgi:tetratricopeptide (TPR) repeat protein
VSADGQPPDDRSRVAREDEVGYGVREVAGLFGLAEHRLRYWSQTGFIVPSLRREGRSLYSFRDLVAIKVAKALVDDGVSLRRIRRSLALLRANLPGVDTSLARLRVRCDDDRVIVDDGERSFEADSGQLVLDFSLASLRDAMASVVALPRRDTVDEGPQGAHDWFRRGCELDQERAGAPADLAGLAAARHAYETALGLEPNMAAAWTNLGGLLAEIGDQEGAREHFEEALRCDPDQVEALCNLAELALRDGDHEQAISTYRHVLRTAPDWYEAHYGLARALLAVGGRLQALAHLERFCAAVAAIAPELRDPEVDARRASAVRFAAELRAKGESEGDVGRRR